MIVVSYKKKLELCPLLNNILRCLFGLFIEQHPVTSSFDVVGDNNGQWMNGTNNGDLMADLNGYGDRSDFSASGIDP